MDGKIPSSLSRIYESVLRILRLHLEGARLSLAQKLTVMLSTAAICLAAAALGFMAVVFVSIALSMLLAESISAVAAFFIMAGIYVMLVIVLILLRKPLIINPVARFLSRVLLDAPRQTESESANSSPSDEEQVQ